MHKHTHIYIHIYVHAVHKPVANVDPWSRLLYQQYSRSFKRAVDQRVMADMADFEFSLSPLFPFLRRTTWDQPSL